MIKRLAGFHPAAAALLFARDACMQRRASFRVVVRSSGLLRFHLDTGAARELAGAGCNDHPDAIDRGRDISAGEAGVRADR